MTPGPPPPAPGERLRVLFLATYFPRPGNPLIGPWALAQAKALARLGIDLRVVSFTSWVPRVAARSPGAKAFACCPPRHDWDGIEVDYPRWLLYQIGPLKRWAHRDPRAQLALAAWSADRALHRAVREVRPHVVYAHHTAVNGYLAARLHERHGLPFVVTDHDFDEVRDCEQFPARRRVFARVAGRAACMVAVASRMERDLRRLFPAARTLTIHNGFDPPLQALPPRPAALAGRTVVFSAGMMYERKGFTVLVEAFARIAQQHPNAVLRIAGDGPDRASVERAANATGLGARIELLGALPHERVLAEMGWCDVFALVGWDEPFATVYLEAAAIGRPMVLANDGGFNDVFRDGVHGWSVPPRDVSAAAGALERLLADPVSRTRMGNSAHALWAERLTWDANARALVDLLHDAARRAGRSAQNHTSL